MLELHHFDQPRARPVWWLLEELGLSYNFGKRTNSSGFSESDALRGSSLGALGSTSDAEAEAEAKRKEEESSNGVYAMIARSVAASLSGALPPRNLPTLRDGEIIVRESAAIVEYLIATHGKGRFQPPKGRPQNAQDDAFFKHFAEGSFMPPLVLKLVFSTINEQAPWVVRPFIRMVANQISASFIDPIIKTNFSLMHQALSKDGGRQFLAGGREPTAGDFMMSHPVEMAISSGAFKDDEIPKSMRDYLSRIQVREAYQRASQKINPVESSTLQMPSEGGSHSDSGPSKPSQTKSAPTATPAQQSRSPETSVQEAAPTSRWSMRGGFHTPPAGR